MFDATHITKELPPPVANMTHEEEEAAIQREYDGLIEDYLNSNHRRKVEKIEKAFNLAKKAHEGARRRSGEPYILHPLAVARIACKEMGLGSTSIVCALLHDVVEDTEYTTENLRELFGSKVADIVEGLTKISGETFREKVQSTQAENFRKLILTMNDDVRVILIKIADRLHNMRTLDSMPPRKQLKIVGETLYIYAPIAHRLGLFSIKSELEELSFKIEHLKEFEELKEKIRNTEQHRQEIFEHFAAPLRKAFAKIGLHYEMKARVKSTYSIWRKMQEKKISFEDVYDLFAVRIVFESDLEMSDKNRCWQIYSIITDIYRVKTDRIRDWVSNPKSNGYRALHLTVMGPDGSWIEVQIRSQKMDDIAELGFAAHWKYKSQSVEEDSEFEKWIATIREILENPTPDSLDFLDTIKLNLFSEEIKVFTPQGDTIALPQGATALDFAYAIHEEVGMHCIGAKVNHKLVPFSSPLQNGDQISIITGAKQFPSPGWREYVTTGKARSHIDAFLRKKRRELVTKGEEQVIKLFERDGIAVSSSELDRVAHYFNFHKREDFFYAVGTGSIILPNSFKKLMQEGDSRNFFTRLFRTSSKNKPGNTSGKGEEDTKAPRPDTKKPYLLKEHNFKTNYEIADCCRPIYGDETIGFIESRGTVTIHKRSCSIANKLKSSMGDKIVETIWSTHPQSTFEGTLEVKGMDSTGILNAVVQNITGDFNIPITNINLSVHEGVFAGTIKVLVRDTNSLAKVCEELKKNPSISSVARI